MIAWGGKWVSKACVHYMWFCWTQDKRCFCVEAVVMKNVNVRTSVITATDLSCFLYILCLNPTVAIVCFFFFSFLKSNVLSKLLFHVLSEII